LIIRGTCRNNIRLQRTFDGSRRFGAGAKTAAHKAGRAEDRQIGADILGNISDCLCGVLAQHRLDHLLIDVRPA